MALQYSAAVRNAKLDAVESTIGTSAVLKLRTGSAPANVATADSGTVVATLSLPSDWMEAAGTSSPGVKGKSGTWSLAAADNTGVIAHWRLYASDGTTCHAQGTATITTGGGDMELDAVSVTAGQTVTITAFTLTAGNA